jgi:hypothetical protein
MPDPPRRFPAPWRADTIPGGYVVRDANGQAIAYIYSRETEVEARQAKVLTADEARRIAINIARLPDQVSRNWSAPWRMFLSARLARLPRPPIEQCVYMTGRH